MIHAPLPLGGTEEEEKEDKEDKEGEEDEEGRKHSSPSEEFSNSRELSNGGGHSDPHTVDGQLEGGSGGAGSQGPSPGMSGKKRAAPPPSERRLHKQPRHDCVSVPSHMGMSVPPAKKKGKRKAKTPRFIEVIEEVPVPLEYTLGFKVLEINELDVVAPPSPHSCHSLSPSDTDKVSSFFNPFNPLLSTLGRLKHCLIFPIWRWDWTGINLPSFFLIFKLW